MKIKTLLITTVLGALLYLLVITPLLKEQSFHRVTDWVASRSTAFAHNSTTLSDVDKSNPLTATTDLLITKSSSPVLATIGEPLIYTIVVSNTGPATAYNLTIADTLPAGVHFQGDSTLTLVKGSDPHLQVSLRILTGTVGSLLPTGSVEIIGRTLVETTGNGATLSNTAYVTATNATRSSRNRMNITTPLLTATPTTTATPTPPQPPTPTASPTTTSIATVPTPTATPTLIATAMADQADLEIRKSVAYKAVIAGASLTYTIQVNNFGPGPANTLVIQDRLPEGLVFEGPVRLSFLHGEGSQLVLTQEQLTATISLLNVTGIITITAPVRTASTAPTAILVNQASITSTTHDPQPGNNRATASLTVIAAPPSTESYFLPLIKR